MAEANEIQGSPDFRRQEGPNEGPNERLGGVRIGARVFLADGSQGTVTGFQDQTGMVWLERSGESRLGAPRLGVPWESLQAGGRGEWHLAISWPAGGAEGIVQVLPVIQEQLWIEPLSQVVGQVVVAVRNYQEYQSQEVVLEGEVVEVQRVAVNRLAQGPETVRQEGDVTIVPVLEECLVVEKQLRVVEELHLIRHRQSRRQVVGEALWRQEAQIRRLAVGPAGEKPENAP